MLPSRSVAQKRRSHAQVISGPARRAGESPSAGRAQILSRERPIQLSPKSVAVPNMEKLDVFESRKQIMRLLYLFPLREPICEEGPLLREMSNAFLDLGLRTIELSVQLSLIFHLVHPAGERPDYQ